eukprot:1098193-Karenia_brevis.AAC.1
MESQCQANEQAEEVAEQVWLGEITVAPTPQSRETSSPSTRFNLSSEMMPLAEMLEMAGLTPQERR